MSSEYIRAVHELQMEELSFSGILALVLVLYILYFYLPALFVLLISLAMLLFVFGSSERELLREMPRSLETDERSER
jgi:uncharacterized membrane protein